jgi:predicted NUDIX family phosphoesterase
VAEEVWCIRREDVFGEGPWWGLRPVPAGFLERIRERGFLMPRARVEEDAGYQQVIPYAVFRHRDRYLLTRRLRASSERRLRHLYSLGVGGHVNPGDLGPDPIAAGLRREWAEEVSYAGQLGWHLLGLLKEESSPVGRVHLGVVFLADGDSPEISIRETHKLAGELLTLEQMRVYYLQMESWSQLIYDHLATLAVPGADRLG